MSALFYIIKKSVKNSLRELIKKPGKLVMYLLMVAMIVGLIFLSFFTKAHVEQTAPMFWFTGILFAFIAIFVVIALKKGLASGDAIFEMYDVNLLFVSPVNPRQVLLYGLVRMVRTAFLAGLFILFQSNSLANFGIGYGGVLLTFAGFWLSMVVMLIASLLIYAVTNGNPARKRQVKLIAVLVFLPLAAFFIARYLGTGDLRTALETAIRSPFMGYIPVAGWTARGVTAFLSGQWAGGLLYFGLNVLFGAAMLGYIFYATPDYYEDVLVATETAYEKKRAMAEGNLSAAMGLKKAVRTTKTGIPGSGAAAIFGKHLRESFRENRFGILTLSSVLVTVGAVVLSLFIKNLLIVMQILMWCQIMLIGTGRGLKETYSHYIYLIPESSFKKILWSNMEIMARTLLESILIFGISGAVLGVGFVEILVYLLTYTLFSLLLLGVNYVLMRLSGTDVSAGLMILIYFLAVIIAMAPGIVLAILAGSILGNLIGVLVLAAWELAAGLGCFALSKGVLHSCDMAMMKTSK